LAVSSGRADAFTTTVLASMVAKVKNPGLGEFVNPKPRIALPGYIGMRLEDDQRFQKLLNRWAEWNIMLRHNEQRMKVSLMSLGIDEIPSTVSFAPNGWRDRSPSSAPASSASVARFTCSARASRSGWSKRASRGAGRRSATPAASV